MSEVRHADADAENRAGRSGPHRGGADRAPWDWRRTFHDADEQAACVAALYPQRYEQSGPGCFFGEMTRIDLGGIIVVRECVNRRLFQSGAMRNLSIGWLERSDGRFRVNGQDLGPHRALLYGKGSDFEMLCGPSELIGISVVPELLAEEERDFIPACAAKLAGGVREVPPALEATLRRAATDALTLLYKPEETGDCAALRAFLRNALLRVVLPIALLPRVDEPSVRRRARTHERVVLAATREIAANLTQPLSIDELSHRVGVSRRNLFYAFETMLDESPRRYLQTMRLNAVRRAIKRADRGGDGIADVAWAWGFAHASRFAADYKRLFGELPSQTARRHSGGGR